MLSKAKDFWGEVKTELGKVTWPTRKETMATTWVVVAIVLIMAVYLGICDAILTKLMRYVLR